MKTEDQIKARQHLEKRRAPEQAPSVQVLNQIKDRKRFAKKKAEREAAIARAERKTEYYKKMVDHRIGYLSERRLDEESNPKAALEADAEFRRINGRCPS